MKDSIATAQLYVDVILPIPIEKPYTYSVPAEFNDRIDFGLRVEVQFGKSKRYAAIIVDVSDVPPDYRTKGIIDVIDDTPLIDAMQLKLWQWMAAYYCCSIGEVMQAALPANYKLSSETIVYKLDTAPEPGRDVNDKGFLLLEALANRQEMSLEQVRDLLDIHAVLPLIHDLYRKGYIAVYEQLKEKYKPQLVKFVKLAPHYAQDSDNLHEALELTKRSEKQTRALLALIQVARNTPLVEQRKITRKADVGGDVIRALEKKEIVVITELAVNRIPVSTSDEAADFTLSPKQSEVYDDIHSIWNEKEVALLHGATGSGKTWIYKQLIKDTLEEGKQALFLLPEIALTVQIVQRLTSIFGERVVVAHSGLNNNERADLWRRVQDGAPIILGVRSSLFLPYKDLGVVIVDEEHDASYKQTDPAPRYQGRDTAIYLATQWKAKVLLGTATPSVESFFNAQKGKYGLVTLNERYQAAQYPVIRLVDLRKQRLGKDSQFSQPLVRVVEETLAKDEQVILFKNRRGYAPVVRCHICGWQAMCDRCDVALTYHKYRNLMQCHMCGFNKRIPISCPACASTEIRLEGHGTQKIEDEIAALFADATVKRMDLDTTRGKHAYRKLIEQFERQEIDILVGTQMVTKGLDFDHVGLVGVLHADQQLYLPHYRAVERTFQLLVQVSGRAGRKHTAGNVVIQTYNPTHPVFADVMLNDYLSFFNREIVQRKVWKYPPYYYLIKLTLKHKNKTTVSDAARLIAQQLKNRLGNRVIGPAEPPVARLRNHYLMDIGIKVEKQGNLIGKVKEFLREQIAELKKQKGLTTVRVNVDVDPG